jgi:membrane dipeptidase
LTLWADKATPADRKPVGYILSLEGADSLVTVGHLEQAYASGLRAVGPAHYGPGRYAQGTDARGGLGAQGRALLKEMERLNIILDATHLCDDSFWEALDHNRQYSDDQIRTLAARGAVIGAALDAWMMVPGWVRGQSTPQAMHCNLEVVVDHIDHICQLTGSAQHVGIGTDLDGAFGREQCPYDLETIADLQKLPALLDKRGYSSLDIESMMHGNWLRFLRNVWP